MKLTWADFQSAVLALSSQLKGYTSKDGWAIFGEPRGGLPLAVALSHQLGLPLVTELSDKVIWVDDLIATGETLDYRKEDEGYQCIIPVVWVDQRRAPSRDVLSVLKCDEKTTPQFPWEPSPWSGAMDEYAVESLYHSPNMVGSLFGQRVSVLTLASKTFRPTHARDIQSSIESGGQWVIVQDKGQHDLKPLVKIIQETGRSVAIETMGMTPHGLGLGDKLILSIPKEKTKLSVPILAAANEIHQQVSGAKQIHRLENLINNVSISHDCDVYLLPQINHTRIMTICYNAQIKWGWKMSPKLRCDIREYVIREGK